MHANLVPVPALVKGVDGNIVYGLRAQDFIVEAQRERRPRISLCYSGPVIGLKMSVSDARTSTEDGIESFLAAHS